MSGIARFSLRKSKIWLAVVIRCLKSLIVPIENLRVHEVIQTNYLQYLILLGRERLEARMSHYRFNSTDSGGLENSDVASVLEENGIVIVNQCVLDYSEYDFSKISRALSKLIINTSSNSDIELEEYEQIVGSRRLFVNKRTRCDVGMFDVFNVDSYKSDLILQLICDLKSYVLDVLNETKRYRNYEYTNCNLYVNRSVTETRGFHMDDPNNSVKCFLYLSDVLSVDDGPYCYVAGSHLLGNSSLYDADRLLNGVKDVPSDRALLEQEKMVVVFGKAGSLVISDQSGAHRGIPQREGRERMLLMLRFSKRVK